MTLLLRTLRPLALAAATAALVYGPLTAPAAAQGRTPRGSWLVQVQLLTACTGGAPLPAFWSMLTFADGGTLTGSTMNAAFAAGQRGPDHGTWEPAAGGGFVARSLAFVNFTTPPAPPSPGFQAGAQLIEQRLTMQGDDAFTSTATVTFYDLTASPYRQGCAIATGRRMP
jgi:hypothetical protein